MKKDIRKGLQDELAFCLHKLSQTDKPPLEHWSIRKDEIEKELKRKPKKVK